MITLTVNIDNKKTEKAVKTVLDALGLTYSIKTSVNPAARVLNKAEQKIYDNIKQALKEIKLHQDGKLELRDARDLISELF